MVNLLDQTVLVTGASSGIGKDIAIHAAESGANLILVARNTEQLQAVKQQCLAVGSEYSNHFYLSIDLSDEQAILDGVDTIYDNFQNIDVLVNAAGFGDFSNYLETDFSTVKKMFQVNVLGLMLLTRSVASHMIEREHGHIINVGSMAGKIETPKSAAYSATKAAVIGFSDGLRLELKPFNVFVTTVNPGPVATNFFKVADHSGNYLKSVEKFVLDPDKLAWEVVNVFNKKKREINRPRYMELASVLYKMAPSVGDYLAGTFGNRK